MDISPFCYQFQNLLNGPLFDPRLLRLYFRLLVLLVYWVVLYINNLLLEILILDEGLLLERVDAQEGKVLGASVVVEHLAALHVVIF